MKSLFLHKFRQFVLQRVKSSQFQGELWSFETVFNQTKSDEWKLAFPFSFGAEESMSASGKPPRLSPS
jgi:hypothetical protein